MNQLTGSMPSEVGLLIDMTDLSFSYQRKLQGTILSEVYSLLKLNYLD
jgi:hypothetical protein